MMKKRNILLILIGIVIGFIIFFPDYSNFIDKVVSLGLLGNVIDFFGNIVIAIMSAVIAWIVSKNEIKKEMEMKRVVELHEKKTYLELLIIEMKTHKKVLDNIIEQKIDSEKELNSELKNMDNSVWSYYIEKFHLDPKNLKSLFIYYLKLSKLSELKSSEVLKDNYDILKDMILENNKAVKIISEEKEK